MFSPYQGGSSAGQYIGLYDYTARLDGDLTFRRGDRMIIINNSQGDWWEARLTRQGGEIFVLFQF